MVFIICLFYLVMSFIQNISVILKLSFSSDSKGQSGDMLSKKIEMKSEDQGEITSGLPTLSLNSEDQKKISYDLPSCFGRL